MFLRGGASVFSMTLIAVGKCKEKFYLDAVREYEKRLGAYCKFRVLELPEVLLGENPSPSEIENALKKEAETVRKHIPKGAFFCVFTPEGDLLSSEDLAKTLGKVKVSGKNEACFLIGSSFGMAEELKKEANLRLSMGRMTFPHHLFRVMATEQLYRAEAIQAGSRYHK